MSAGPGLELFRPALFQVVGAFSAQPLPFAEGRESRESYWPFSSNLERYHYL